MKKENEWDEIEKDLQNREEEAKEKYGLDITKKFQDSLKEENIYIKKRRNFIIKAVSVILMIILILIVMYNMNADFSNINILKLIDFTSEFGFKEVSSETNLMGNGFFVYKPKDMEEIEIHCLYDKTKDICKHDIDARYYKYYFERWEDTDKDKFIVSESYEDAICGMRKKEDWLLNYETYIEANTYEEMLYATEAIIRFVEYMGNSNILIKSFIKMGDKRLLPHNVSDQTSEQIRQRTIQQYHDIIENNGTSY